MRVEAERRRIRRLSLTPLIDVVFLLLLFFMLSSTFERYRSLEMDGGAAGSAAAGHDVLLLRIAEDGGFDLAGGPVGADELVERLVAIAAGRTVRLAVLPRTETALDHVVRALEAARRAGIRNVVVVK